MRGHLKQKGCHGNLQAIKAREDYDLWGSRNSRSWKKTTHLEIHRVVFLFLTQCFLLHWILFLVVFEIYLSFAFSHFQLLLSLFD